MNMPQGPDWRDARTISAAEGWLRLAVGAAFALILLIMMAVGKLNPADFIKYILGVMALDRTANGVLALIRARNQQT